MFYNIDFIFLYLIKKEKKIIVVNFLVSLNHQVGLFRKSWFSLPFVRYCWILWNYHDNLIETAYSNTTKWIIPRDCRWCLYECWYLFALFDSHTISVKIINRYWICDTNLITVVIIAAVMMVPNSAVFFRFILSIHT